jgi:hypothetical protein
VLTIFGRAEEKKGIEKFCGLYHSSRDIVRMMKSMRMRWVGHVAHAQQEKCVQSFGG